MPTPTRYLAHVTCRETGEDKETPIEVAADTAHAAAVQASNMGWMVRRVERAPDRRPESKPSAGSGNSTGSSLFGIFIAGIGCLGFAGSIAFTVSATDRFDSSNAIGESANILADIRGGVFAIAFIGLACFGMFIVRLARK